MISRNQFLFCILSSFALLSNGAAAKTWNEVRFGVEAEVPPFESRNDKGELVGLDIEIGNALCAELKIRCTWIDQPYDGNIAALKANRFDAIMPMTPTEIRRREIDFTDVIYPLSNQLVARKGAKLLPTEESLKGKRVGVLRGTSREAFAIAKWGSAGVHIQSFGLNSELIESLLAGRIDATLQETIEITEALLSKPEGQGFDFSGPAMTDPRLGSGVAMGVRQGDPELKEMLNRALTAIKANGVYKGIVTRYLSSNKATAEAFVDAFYSFDPLQLESSLASAPDSKPAILFYQGWAEGGNYKVVARKPCVPVDAYSIACSITVKDDLIGALGINFNVTDTFTLRFSDKKIVAVGTGSDDPPEYHAAKKWVKEHHPELIEIPCKGLFAGGPTPGACARAMVVGYSQFAASASRGKSPE